MDVDYPVIEADPAAKPVLTWLQQNQTSNTSFFFLDIPIEVLTDPTVPSQIEVSEPRSLFSLQSRCSPTPFNNV